LSLRLKMKLSIKGKSIYYDAGLIQNLDFFKGMLKKNWDMAFCIDGIEGGGKSVFAQQLALYFDNDFSLDRIVFTPQEFLEAVDHAPKHSAIVYDEAFTGFSSTSALSYINKTIIGKLTRIRRKNLVLFIVAPNFWTLNKYIAIHRTRALFHVYTDKVMSRGFFKAWNYQRKKDLYLKGKDSYNYLVPKNIHGRFTNKWVLNEKDYDQKKMEAEENQIDEIEQKYLAQRNALVLYLNRHLKVTQNDIANVISENTQHKITRKGVTDIIARMEANPIKLK
jgi:hypothetical protein